MKWVAEISTPKKMSFIIEQDSRAGFYIYVFEDDKGIDDYLQDTLEMAQRFALRRLQVPLDAWKEVEG